MTPTFNLKTMFVLLTSAALLGTTLQSCKKDETPTPATNTITDKVVAGASFTLLEKAVVKAGLASTLSGTGPFTVFAPDDAAFAASGLTAASIDALSVDSLKKILLYHTLASKVLAANVPAGPNAKVLTANTTPDSIFVTKNSSGVYVNGIKVNTADVTADNGVIHVMSKVLLPAKGNVVQTAIGASGGDNSLDSLVVAVVRADAANPGLINLLSSATLTVFAPTNKAFRDLLSGLSLNNISQIPIATLTAVLQYHVVAGRKFSSDLTNGSLAMFANGSTTVSLAGPTIKGANGVLSLSVAGTTNNTCNIIATNILCRNGAVHVIDRVLLP